MKKYLLTLFILLFGASSYGNEVVRLDVKGAKLGMSPEDIINKRHCNYSKIKGNKINGVIISTVGWVRLLSVAK